MKPWERLVFVCSLLQIIGLVLIVWRDSLPPFTPVLIGISGFAGMAKYLLLDPRTSLPMRRMHLAAAVCGALIILLACMQVSAMQ